MKSCTFFGHKDCPDIKQKLRQVLEKLITEHQIDTFYVGDEGSFDWQVRSVLQLLQKQYPHIRYGVVLAYIPSGEPRSDTMFPEGLEYVHPRYAIDRRNRWMLFRAQYVICYVNHPWGGAAKFKKLAETKRKMVINLYREEKNSW